MTIVRRVGRCPAFPGAWIWGDCSFFTWSSGSLILFDLHLLLCSSLFFPVSATLASSSLTMTVMCLLQSICTWWSHSLTQSSPSYPHGLLPPFTSLLKCVSHDELLYHRSEADLKDGGDFGQAGKRRGEESFQQEWNLNKTWTWGLGEIRTRGLPDSLFWGTDNKEKIGQFQEGVC